jgi:hypothetical protein
MGLQREDQIRQAYLDILGHDADPEGLNFWMNSGLNIDQIRQEFSRFLDMRRAEETETERLRYEASERERLMQSPISAIEQFWAQPAEPVPTLQEQAQYNPLMAIEQFWNPPVEQPARFTQDPRYNTLISAYRTFLGREPYEEELEQWLGSGTSAADIVSDISGSYEAQVYGGAQPTTSVWTGGNQN